MHDTYIPRWSSIHPTPNWVLKQQGKIQARQRIQPLQMNGELQISVTQFHLADWRPPYPDIAVVALQPLASLADDWSLVLLLHTIKPLQIMEARECKRFICYICKVEMVFPQKNASELWVNYMILWDNVKLTKIFLIYW